MFIILLLAVCILCWKWYTKRHLDEPPIRPGLWPFIGHLHLVLGNTSDLWRQVKSLSYDCMNMGHVLTIYFGPCKAYILTDPDDIYKVSNSCLQKDTISTKLVKELLGEGLSYSPVPTWKKQRKLLNPTFNQQILDSYMNIFNSQGKRLVQKLADKINKGPFNHSLHIQQNLMETVYLTVLDDTISEKDAQNYTRAFQTFLNCNVTRFQKPWLYFDIIYRFSKVKSKLDACSKILYDMSDSVLQKKRTEHKLRTTGGSSCGEKLKRLIDLLLDLDEDQLSDKEIRNEINVIMMAGHDTTANTLIFILLLIGSYSQVQDKIFNEIKEIFGDTDVHVDKQNLSKLVYLEAVIKESMRLYNTAPLVTRYIDQEVKLKNCTLQPGNNCLLMLHSIHRNPMWGADVDEFKPERWLDPAMIPKTVNAFAAFSLGRRNCIGKTYAMMVMKILLAHVVCHYKIHSDHTKLVVQLDAMLKPVNGHYISIEKRIK